MSDPHFPGMLRDDSLLEELSAEGHSAWAAELHARCVAVRDPGNHGDLTRWRERFQLLPGIQSHGFDVVEGSVRVSGDISDTHRSQLNSALMSFRPWRKGPFDLFGIYIDAEWRSDLKWARLADHLDLRDRSVLDVGCGNGYYGWRMLDAGARRVVGLDPFLLYVMQHEIVKRYAGPDLPNFVLPLGDDCLPSNLNAFDVTLSMGVLYHRTSPIDHLQTLRGTLKPGGQLLLETLVIDSEQETVLVPEGRYAKMRNVWFIPSVRLLKIWLGRTGFTDIRAIDVSPTTTAEQRRTEWMTFESLSDFLDPDHPRHTIEGYPAPVRAILMAQKK